MKKILSLLILCALFVLYGSLAQAGEVDVLVQKLVEKNILTPAEAQIIVDETKVQVAKELAHGQSLSVPEWTQRIKWGGDVRYRTQGDWQKPKNTGTPSIEDQRWRNRIRGRFYMEGKVNDSTYAGVRFAGGLTQGRSTNDTIGGNLTDSSSGGTNTLGSTSYLGKTFVMFDQYYMRFEVPAEIRRAYGQYFSDLKLWAGKFPIPFECSELTWDSDINPGGVALQYSSPDIKLGSLPSVNLYSNLGFFWLDESASINTDPLLFGYQVGAKTEPFGPLGSVANIAVSWYDFANMKNKTPVTGSGVSAGTNSRVWAGDGLGSALIGSYRYEYNVFSLLMQLDNSKIMDFEFPHGFYADFIANPAAPSENTGYLLGGYIGKKKIKEPGDWKIRAEMRYIGRDSIPDFMPDSDFYGFGTNIANTVGTNGVNNDGTPAEGGTNGKGINLAFEYMLLKNTSLNFEYYWCKPIKTNNLDNPIHELQMDVITKF